GGGVVTVRIVTFNDNATSNGFEYSSAPGATHTLADAINYINSFTEAQEPAGSLYPETDYDDAIAEAGEIIDDNWGAPRANEYNVVYFVSDGAPLNSQNQAGDNVTISNGAGSEQAVWQAILQNKNAIAYAVGIDVDNAVKTHLLDVAYPSDDAHVFLTSS